MDVKSEGVGPSDTEVFDAYVEALPPNESQAISGGRVGRDQSWMSRKLKARAKGLDVSLGDSLRRELVRWTAALDPGGPTARARRDALQMAAREVQALADKLRALATAPPEDARDALDLADDADLGTEEKREPGG